MGPASDKSYCPQEAESATAAELYAVNPQSAETGLAPAQLLQEYTQLRERFLRTTNALASATHDLKTPLAILNGYMELLASERLGSLNERHPEDFRVTDASGRRLQR